MQQKLHRRRWAVALWRAGSMESQATLTWSCRSSPIIFPRCSCKSKLSSPSLHQFVKKSIPKHHEKSGFAMNCLFIYSPSPFLFIVIPAMHMEFVLLACRAAFAERKTRSQIKRVFNIRLNKRLEKDDGMEYVNTTRYALSDALQMRWYFSLNFASTMRWMLTTTGGKSSGGGRRSRMFFSWDKEVVGPTQANINDRLLISLRKGREALSVSSFASRFERWFV